MSKHPNNGCLHQETDTKDGFIVCKKCGMTLDEHIVDTQTYNEHYDYNSRYFRQYVSPGNTLTSCDNLGSVIKYEKKGFNPRYHRMKVLNHGDAYQIKMHKDIYFICNDLDIPEYVHKDALYRFRKLKSEKVVKHQQTYFALAYCLWTSIKYYGLTINLRNVIETFKKRGHTCSTKYVFMNKTKYDRVFQDYDIKLNELRQVKEYIHPLIQELRPTISIKNYITFETELKYEVLNRLKQGSYIKKIAKNTEYSDYMVRKQVLTLESNNYIKKKPRTASFVLYKLNAKAKAFLNDYSKKRKLEYEFKDYYLTELEKLSLTIEEKLSDYIKMSGRTPYNKCCALLYFADRLLALKNEHFPLLTQRSIANHTNNDTVNIRLAWLELFQDFYKKEKKRLEKKRGAD